MQFKLIITATAALSAAGSIASAATLINVVDVTMNNPAVVNLSGPGIDQNVYDSSLLFTTKSGAVIPVFCVDIWHEIATGPANITFKEQTLSNNSAGSFSGTGAALSATQIGEISGLADLGAGLVKGGDAHLATDLAGVQAAIWSIEYPAVTVTGDAAVMNRLSYYEGYAAAHPASAAIALYDVAGAAQGQVMGVPEPASWSLMLLGFGALGAAMRASRRHRAPVSAAAALI